MSDQVINQPDLKMTRDQFQKFIGEEDPQAIRTLERQLAYVNELYRKPSIALFNNDTQLLPNATYNRIIFDTVAYENDVAFEPPYDIVFLKAGRYRISFQCNVSAQPKDSSSPAPPPEPKIYFWFRLNGLDLKEGTLDSFVVPDFSLKPIAAEKSISLFSYVGDIEPQDRLVVYSMSFDFVSCGLSFTTPAIFPAFGTAGAASYLYVERVY